MPCQTNKWAEGRQQKICFSQKKKTLKTLAFFFNKNDCSGKNHLRFPIVHIIIIICRAFSSLVVDGVGHLQPICSDRAIIEESLRGPGHLEVCIPECIEWGHKAEIVRQIEAVNQLYWYTGKWFYQFSRSVTGAADWTACHLRECVCTKLSCSEV